MSGFPCRVIQGAHCRFVPSTSAFNLGQYASEPVSCYPLVADSRSETFSQEPAALAFELIRVVKSKLKVYGFFAQRT
jgi:hypothetical protein